MRPSRLAPPAMQGFILVTAMIFLLVLTLVAVIAVKGSGLELRMSANNALHAEAFEAAEGPRQVINRLIERLGFNAETGWPAAIGGGTPDDVFGNAVPNRISILNSGGTTGGTPVNWFTDLSEADFSYTTFTPRAQYVTPTGSTLQVSAQADVKRARTAPKTGCDLSSGGYDGVSARSCVDYLFLVTSRGVDPSSTLTDNPPKADYETSSMYRYVPR